MKCALAGLTALALLASGCCSGPGPRRMIGPPPFVGDAGRDAPPFFFPTDAGSRMDARTADADARGAEAGPPADSADGPDAGSTADAAPDGDASDGTSADAALDAAVGEDATLADAG